MNGHEIIIQGTPTGMYPAAVNKTLIPKGLLRPQHVVFDMVYRPMNTRLLQEAREAGCTVVPGLDMLLNQAALQFEIWTKKPAPRHIMRQALTHALNET
jgi:shikimate 5-dehydrogenase